MSTELCTYRALRLMPWLLGLYATTTLIHFAHNAEYLAQYPNLPSSWSRADVYLAWGGVTAIGLLGYVLYYRHYWRAGLVVLALYACLGFDGLLHYTRAPLTHHSTTMNLTIWAEVVAAALFLVNLASIATAAMRRRVPA